ncbi:MAG: SRPBCC domain-containing protein [Streptosporangiales bacterium]|nr:SRPBCC domain-containing protein [Streptosporangiales bacterium]
MTNPLAMLDTVDGKPALRFTRRLAHPQDKVWRAVTDPAEMAHWFPARITTELRVGAPMRFSFGDDELDAGDRWARGEIIELDPPKVYAFRWNDSVIRVELVPDGAGCVLHFSETLGGAGTHGDRPSVARQAPGWEACLLALTAHLDGTPAPATDQAWFLAHAERYVEEFGLGEGEARETAGGFVVRFERDLVPARDAVWELLTEDGEPVVGAVPPVRLTHGYTAAGAVTAVEPGRVLEYAYRDGADVAGHVRFELRHQEPLGTRLVVTQTVPARLADTLAVALAAWQTHLELLFAALHGDVRRPWPTERTDELTKRYADRPA